MTWNVLVIVNDEENCFCCWTDGPVDHVCFDEICDVDQVSRFLVMATWISSEGEFVVDVGSCSRCDCFDGNSRTTWCVGVWVTV